MSNEQRVAKVTRDTQETQISLAINLDGSGIADLSTGLPFFEHMLTQIARHGLIDIELAATGDLQVDAHHTVEDVGIVLGQALDQALGDKSGLYRYGHAYVPLDEALSRAVVDLSGRPGLSPSPGGDFVQGVWPCAADGGKRRLAHAGSDSVHQRQPVDGRQLDAVDSSH